MKNVEKKPLLYGFIGFLIGGMIVAIVAGAVNGQTSSSSHMDMAMEDMTASLKGKSGDEYDKVFLSEMLKHHEGAVAMAKLSAENAKHAEIKRLSLNIITNQQKEIDDMQQWQQKWGYVTANSMKDMKGMDH